MKAMSQTLVLVVAAVVILVTALVVLVMFQQGIQPAVGLTEAKSLCQTHATTSCTAFGQMPPTWNVENMRVVRDGKPQTVSCSSIEGLTNCRCNENKLECGAAGSSEIDE